MSSFDFMSFIVLASLFFFGLNPEPKRSPKASCLGFVGIPKVNGEEGGSKM